MISVLMAAYREDLSVFSTAVMSILNQDNQRPELVLVLDDPENFELSAWVDENIAQRENVTILRNEQNIGLARSLNRAIENASGDFFCRMDADDIAHHDRLGRQLSYLLDHDLDLIGSRVNVMDEQGTFLYTTPQSPTTPEKVKKALKWNNCLAHPTWFGRREVFLQKYRKISLCEDYDFQIRAVLNGYKLGNCEDITVDYRFSDNGLSRSSLYRQYLYQKYLTKEYALGRMVEVDKANEYVQDRYSEAKAKRYSQANEYFQNAMNLVGEKKIGYAFLNGLKSVATSFDFVDKIRRLVLTSIA